MQFSNATLTKMKQLSLNLNIKNHADWINKTLP